MINNQFCQNQLNSVDSGDVYIDGYLVGLVFGRLIGWLIGRSGKCSVS